MSTVTIEVDDAVRFRHGAVDWQVVGIYEITEGRRKLTIRSPFSGRTQVIPELLVSLYRKATA